LSALVSLCAEHAQFERATFAPDGAVERWQAAIFGATPRLRVWVAQCDARLVGYASAAAEYSTWSAAEYLHLDCLFVRAGQRGCGVGGALLHAWIAAARAGGFGALQWQTPQWSLDAVRFYARHGAVGTDKCRFVLPLR